MVQHRLHGLILALQLSLPLLLFFLFLLLLLLIIISQQLFYVSLHPVEFELFKARGQDLSRRQLRAGQTAWGEVLWIQEKSMGSESKVHVAFQLRHVLPRDLGESTGSETVKSGE